MQWQTIVFGDPGDGVDFIERIDRAGLGCLRHGDGGGAAMVNGILRITRDAFDQVFRQHLAIRPFNGDHAHAAEEIRRAAFVFDHMGFRMTEGQAAGAGDAGQRKRVGRRAGGDEKHRDLALEYLVEAFFDGEIEFAGAVSSGKAGGFPRKPFVDGRMGASPIV